MHVLYIEFCWILSLLELMVSNSEIMSQRPFQTWGQKRIFVLMHIHSGSLNNIPMTVQNYVIITWHYDDMQYFCGIIAVRSLIASWKHLLTQKKRPTKDLFYWTKSYLTWKASPCPALYVLSEASFPSVKNICLFSKLLTSTCSDAQTWQFCIYCYDMKATAAGFVRERN